MPYQLEMRGGLTAPVEYWSASSEKIARNCNGCGDDSFLGSLVPETIWGLRVSPVCNIHDFMYCLGSTLEDKATADFVFQKNLIALVRQSASRSWAGWVLKIPREYRCFTYYVAVSESDAGMSAFKASRLR